MLLRDYLKTTSQAALAEKLGITQSAISQWLRGRVPAERVLAIELATEGQVGRDELRPDLYPPAACTAASVDAESTAAAAPESGPEIQREAA